MSPTRVLFLCTGNSARSIIAEAVLREIGGRNYEVFSAGTHPKGVNPFTRQVLELEGLAVGELRSKSLDEYIGRDFDFVITVCDNAAEECPVFPGAPQRLHWSFADPAAVSGSDATKLAAFEATLAGMRERIREFVTDRAGPILF